MLLPLLSLFSLSCISVTSAFWIRNAYTYNIVRERQLKGINQKIHDRTIILRSKNAETQITLRLDYQRPPGLVELILDSNTMAVVFREDRALSVSAQDPISMILIRHLNDGGYFHPMQHALKTGDWVMLIAADEEHFLESEDGALWRGLVKAGRELRRWKDAHVDREGVVRRIAMGLGKEIANQVAFVLLRVWDKGDVPSETCTKFITASEVLALMGSEKTGPCDQENDDDDGEEEEQVPGKSKENDKNKTVVIKEPPVEEKPTGKQANGIKEKISGMLKSKRS